MRRTSISILAFLSLFLLALSGCGGDDGGDGGMMMNPAEPFGACPSDSTAQEMAGAQAITDNCLLCHSASVAGVARQGAPSSRNFDTAADVMQHASRIHARVQAGSMPPSTVGGSLGTADQEAVRVFLACGINLDPPAP